MRARLGLMSAFVRGGTRRASRHSGSLGAESRTGETAGPGTDPGMSDVEFPAQQQEPPGLTGEMRPQPDHGEQSYVGHGRLDGKVALVTGGDSGIGRAVAIAYAREGADVAFTYLPEEHDDAEETVRLIRDAGRTARAAAARPARAGLRATRPSSARSPSSAASTSSSTTPASRWRGTTRSRTTTTSGSTAPSRPTSTP